MPRPYQYGGRRSASQKDYYLDISSFSFTGRSALVVDELLAVTPPDSIGSGFVAMGGSSITPGFESAYSDNEGSSLSLSHTLAGK